ncbi:hypothetical protein [Taklimakanibacter deserti]|uniref:hypothetical protein n=1 Tax=Taklimakanibacter deserti TaxID=2267839 RepID=UPI000E65A87C
MKSRSTLIAIAAALWLQSNLAQAQFLFSLDEQSPEVPAVSQADILESGLGVVISATALGLPAATEIDGLSFGHDQIVPISPTAFVAIFYSVDRATRGLPAGPQPGAGAVRVQVNGNGAAGDIFFLTARFAPGVGMVPITRGLTADSVALGLTPTGGAANESDIDGLVFTTGATSQSVYFSVRGPVPGQNWGPADIIRVDIDPATGAGTPPRVWATAAQLGLGPNVNIDALAIRNRDQNDLTPDDVVWVSLNPPPAAPLPPGEKIIQVFPGPLRLVVNSRVLNVLPGDNVNGIAGVDPDKLGKPKRPPPPPKEQQRKKPERKQKQSK